MSWRSNFLKIEDGVGVDAELGLFGAPEHGEVVRVWMEDWVGPRHGDGLGGVGGVVDVAVKADWVVAAREHHIHQLAIILVVRFVHFAILLNHERNRGLLIANESVVVLQVLFECQLARERHGIVDDGRRGDVPELVLAL